MSDTGRVLTPECEAGHGPMVLVTGYERLHECATCQRKAMTDGRVRASMTPEEKNGAVNVALHPALFDAFVDWLDSRNCDLSPPIPTGDDTFRVVSPRLMAPARLQTPANSPGTSSQE